MDIKKEINSLLKNFDVNYQNSLNSGVIIHIDRAEYYFNQAIIRNDDQYYTDAIYRTNQSYEGILKEAYSVFNENPSPKLRTIDLENYFERENIFNERVKNAFISYRQQWRNPSIHDHRLFFKRDEAFLAIVNVSAFIFILLNQIVEHISYKETKNIIDKGEDEKIHLTKHSNINETLSELLIKYHDFQNKNIESFINESQLLGSIKGYLESNLKEVDVFTEYKGPEFTISRPDIVIKKNSNILAVIEVKNEYHKSRLENGYKQVKAYLYESKLNKGILYFYTGKPNVNYEIMKANIDNLEIISLIPTKNKDN